MHLFKKRDNSKFNLENLYVVSTGKAVWEEKTEEYAVGYSYYPKSVSIVKIKHTNSKICTDVISGRKLYVFDNSEYIRNRRTYCSDIKPLYNFLKKYGLYEDILQKGMVTLDEVCRFFTEMNDSFYKTVIGHS